MFILSFYIALTTFRSDDSVITSITPAKYVSRRQNRRTGYSTDIFFEIYSRVVIRIGISGKYRVLINFDKTREFCVKCSVNVLTAIIDKNYTTIKT